MNNGLSVKSKHFSIEYGMGLVYYFLGKLPLTAKYSSLMFGTTLEIKIWRIREMKYCTTLPENQDRHFSSLLVIDKIFYKRARMKDHTFSSMKGVH